MSSNYYNEWNDLVDLWYLGMQVITSLLQEVRICLHFAAFFKNSFDFLIKKKGSLDR